ncbi:MAG: glycosyltransferase family 9 protein [Lewinellaceae bacterium]|nr:glycosyltransferase family 9 protein [Lewinellaceae bacterium]
MNYEALPVRQLTRQLRLKKYDLVIHFTQYEATLRNLLRDMIYFRFLVGIPAGWGWQFNRLLWYKKTQANFLIMPNERERLNSILHRNGIQTSVGDRYLFHITAEDRRVVDELLAGLPLSGRPVIALVPGAKRPQNRWPVAHFESLIRHFSGQFDIFLIGGPDDLPQIQTLLHLPHTYSFCGLLSPVQSGLLMQRCLLVLSNDTGPMHLAYAFGAPVVALFSNRDFANRWFPPENGINAVLRSTGVSCAVCLSETCPDNICMKMISPEDVITTINNPLSKITREKTSGLHSV